MEEKKSFRIGKAAEMVRVSKRTLVNWEKSGVVPRARRRMSGHRYYTYKDIAALQRVIKQRRPGVSREEAARLLGVTAKCLRDWERSGKIPKAKRNQFGHRFYTEKDLLVLRRIIYPDG